MKAIDDRITSRQYQNALCEFFNDPIRRGMIRNMAFLTVYQTPIFIIRADGLTEPLEMRWTDERAKETYLKLKSELQEYEEYLIGKLMTRSDNSPIEANDEK